MTRIIPPAPDLGPGHYVITRQQLIDALSVTSSPGTGADAIASLADAVLYELRGRRITRVEGADGQASRPPRIIPLEHAKPSDCREGTVVCTRVRYEVRREAKSLCGYKVTRTTCSYRSHVWWKTTLEGTRKLIARQLRKDERDRRRGRIRWYLHYEPPPPKPSAPVVYEVRPGDRVTKEDE